MRIEQSECTAISLYDENKKIDNEMVLIVQKSGGGKSLASEGIIEELHNRGYIVISITDVKDEMELCYAMFEPVEKYHLRELMKQGKKPSKKEVKIYHPFTINMPKTNLPNINWFTIPIKDLDRNKLGFMAETDSETDTVRLLNNAVNDLHNNANLYDLMHYVQTKARTMRKHYYGKEVIEPDKDTFFLETSQKGTMTNVGEIASWFKPFLKDYFITPSNFKLNLNARRILEDQKSYHCLTTKWIKDEKRKYFAILCFFDAIMQNIQHSKHPVCFLIEEVARIAPYKSSGFKQYLADYFRNQLITMRSKGRGCSAVMTSQVWFDVDEKIREKSTQTFFGNLKGVSDIERIAKGLKYKGDAVETLRTLPRNSYIMEGEEEMGEFKLFFPSHCHAEPHYNFLEMYRRHYETVKYTDLIEKAEEHLKEIESFYKKKVMKERQKKIDEAKAEWERTNKKAKAEKELSELKEKIKSEKDMGREEKIKKCWELKRDNPDISLRELADALEVSHITVRQYLKIAKQRDALPDVK